MKITVIKPPSNTRRIYPALGLGYIASVLKHNNYDVEFIDSVAKITAKITVANKKWIASE